MAANFLDQGLTVGAAHGRDKKIASIARSNIRGHGPLQR